MGCSDFKGVVNRKCSGNLIQMQKLRFADDVIFDVSFSKERSETRKSFTMTIRQDEFEQRISFGATEENAKHYRIFVICETRNGTSTGKQINEFLEKLGALTRKKGQ